jgi:predicted HTH domain antitoxin
MNTLTVKFELPAVIASQASLNINNISQEVKKMFALFLYEHKQISLSKACELGEFSQWEFFEMNKQLGISIPVSEEQLQQDMDRLSDV